MAVGSTQPLRYTSPTDFPWGRVGWGEGRTPGVLGGYLGLYRNRFTFYVTVMCTEHISNYSFKTQ